MDYYIPPRKLGDIQVASITLSKDDNNVNYGYQTLYSLTDGIENVALGYQSLYSLTDGDANVGIGRRTMYYTDGGTANVGIGRNALLYCVNGNNNTAIGYNSLNGCTSSNNVGLGRNSGNSITSGSNSVYLGYGAGDHASQKADATNCICIGYNAYSTESNKVVIGNSSITKVEFSDGAQATFSSDATDAATTQALVNKIKDWMIDNKLMAAS